MGPIVFGRIAGRNVMGMEWHLLLALFQTGLHGILDAAAGQGGAGDAVHINVAGLLDGT